MDSHAITASINQFSGLLILLGIAGLTIPLLHRFRISPVLGYLLCGVLVGPYGAGLLVQDVPWLEFLVIRNDEAITHFAHLGIVLLMFMIGLELSLAGLWRMRHHVLGLGGCQIVMTGAVIFAIARLFGNTVELSILLGACFSLSSTAMVMQLLEERDATKTPVGRLSFSILLMQDLAVVPVLVLLVALGTKTDEGIAFLTVRALLVAAGAIVAIYFAGIKILRPVLRYIHPENNPEWLISFVLFLVIGTAMLTEAAGMSAALGAFLAGLLLAETSYRHKIQDIIAPVKGVLMGVFFLSVGMMIDVREVLHEPLWLLAAVLGIGVLKAAVLFLICLAFRQDKATAAETAILLGQGGEFVFVIVTMALAYNIVSAADAQFFMLVAALSLVVTPFVSKLAPDIARMIKNTGRKT